ncbi:MAG: hypothetical protein R3Y43_00435 [Alphaproteobacteria bacterium]
MKFFLSILFFVLTISQQANAQLSSQKDASYLVIMKVVSDYKIDDDEHIKNVESLRGSQRFNDKMLKLRKKLDNSNDKDTANEQVLNVLLSAGQEIDEILNVRF